MNDRRMVFATLTLILQLGITMLVPIVSLTIVGAYLGRRFDADWIAVVLFFAGALGGAQGAWRIIKGIIRDASYDPTSKKMLREEAAKHEDLKEDQ